MEKSGGKIFGGLLIAGVIFYAGYYAGTMAGATLTDHTLAIAGKNATTTADFAPFWRAWNLLEENYLPDTDMLITATSTGSTSPEITDQQKVWGAIEGLATSYGDPYTSFFPPQENEVFKTTISGNFEGVGMEIAVKDGALTVVAPLKSSPAEKAGVKAGDRISKINDTDAGQMKVEDAISLIRGPKGTSVKILFLRGEKNDPTEITIVRNIITLPIIDTRIYNKDKKPGQDVFVIRLYTFSANSSQSFYNALKEYSEQNTTNKLVIDLRGNPGGYLESAVDIASFFLPAGKLIVSESSSKKEQSQELRSKGFSDFSDKLFASKMLILIDSGSASASEILAGALSEQGVATLVGKQTFGKGSVQQLFDITDDTSIKITVARWFTPNHRSISKAGLIPDVIVDMTIDDVKAGRDLQLD